ncbi:hypothetical protein [Flagellimonas sp. 2504JD4-2]
MNFLNKEIETLVKNKKSKSLVKRQISCGIFQDLEDSKSNGAPHKKKA